MEWECIVWIDESIFDIGKNSRQVHLWGTAYERYSLSCIVPTFKSRWNSLMIWDTFAGGQKSRLVFMPKNRHFARDFVEVVYDGELLHFIGKVPHGFLMENGAPVHYSKLCED